MKQAEGAVVFTNEHYKWLKESGLWDMRYGKRCGRRHLLGSVSDTNDSCGTACVEWDLGRGQRRVQWHFADHLENV